MNKILIPLAIALVAGCATTTPDCDCKPCECKPCACAAEPNTLSAAEKAEGWQLLWDGKTGAGWVGEKEKFLCFPKKGWEMKDGVLTVLPCARINEQGKWEKLPADQCRGGGGSIVTVKKFRDFAFKCDFRLTKAANSGIKYFYDENINNGTTLEYQILDGAHPDAVKGTNGNRRVAALYDMMPSNADKYLKPLGEWNSALLVSKGNHVEHWLNGVKVLEYERGGKEFMEAFRKSKYTGKGFDKNGKWGLTPEGRIHIQDHSDSTVSYRNIKIKEFLPECKDSGTSFAKDALQKYVDSGELSGAISVLYKDGVQETACLGYADVDAKRPIAMDNVYMQCSQTKGFCGVTIAILVEEGKLNLDDPVSKYLPEFATLWINAGESNGVKRLVKAKNVLTVRNVMNHTGGFPFELPNGQAMGGWSRRMPLRSVAATAASQPIMFEPGTKVQYSNVGIDIGAAVVEVITGKRWEEFLKERVLDPLGMKDSGFWPTDKQLANKIEMYDVKIGQKAKWKEQASWMQRPYNDDRVFSSAGAGLWTTAADQLKFYKMLMNLGRGENGVRILKEETVKSILALSTRPKGKTADGKDFGGYSLGLNAPVVDGEDQWFGHGGAWGTNCMVNWHKKWLKLWAVQISGNSMRKEANAAADVFFKTKIDNTGADAYTGRLK